MLYPCFQPMAGVPTLSHLCVTLYMLFSSVCSSLVYSALFILSLLMFMAVFLPTLHASTHHAAPACLSAFGSHTKSFHDNSYIRKDLWSAPLIVVLSPDSPTSALDLFSSSRVNISLKALYYLLSKNLFLFKTK
ncbi:hypothetical protein XENOCAPTIV_011363 [Xenoophorus captivus]|uniref:Uncharacterized protein n=1 Tax=Xenoophorus captivus TaxID=1517983 RepID=A0ABV0RGU5_9TELE